MFHICRKYANTTMAKTTDSVSFFVRAFVAFAYYSARIPDQHSVLWRFSRWNPPVSRAWPANLATSSSPSDFKLITPPYICLDLAYKNWISTKNT